MIFSLRSSKLKYFTFWVLCSLFGFSRCLWDSLLFFVFFFESSPSSQKIRVFGEGIRFGCLWLGFVDFGWFVASATMVPMLNSGEIRPESLAVMREAKIAPEKVEMVKMEIEDHLEEEHGSFSKKIKLDVPTPLLVDLFFFQFLLWFLSLECFGFLVFGFWIWVFNRKFLFLLTWFLCSFVFVFFWCFVFH